MAALLHLLAAWWAPLLVLLGIGVITLLHRTLPPDERQLPGNLPEAPRRRLNR
jgi:hypothetical protein